MPILDLSYQHWQGTRTTIPVAWILARHQLRSVLRRRAVKVLLLAAGAFFLTWLAFIYLEIRSGDIELPEAIRVNRTTLELYVRLQRLLHVLLAVAAGADLVALDRRHKALQIYLARPLGARDYVLGKLLPLVILLSLASWIPATLLVFLKVLVTADFAWFRDEGPGLLIAIFGYHVALVPTLALLTLAISSLSASPRLAGVQVIAFLALSSAAGKLFATITRSDLWELLSPLDNLLRIQTWMFAGVRQAEPQDWAALAALAALSGTSAVLLRARLRAVDVVGGS